MPTSITEHDSYLVENWDIDTLIVHLKEQNFKFDDDDFAILCKKKITGQYFLDMTEEKFEKCRLEMGPAMRIAKEAKALKDNTKRPFSSYKNQ